MRRLCFVLLAHLVAVGIAQRDGIHLVNEHIETSTRASVREFHLHPYTSTLFRRSADLDEELSYLLHFSETITESQYDAVQSLSSHPLIYFPHDSLLVMATQQAGAALRAIDGVDWVGFYEDKHKFGPDIHSSTNARRSVDHLDSDALVVEAMALLHIKQGHDESQRMAEEWAAVLRSLPEIKEPQYVEVTAVSAVKLRLRVTAGDLSAAVKALATAPAVHWIEHAPKWATRNKYASGLVQGREVGEFPLFDAGLRGEGEIVSVGDTGLDANMCFFNDPSVPVPVDTVSSTHRKIVSYIKYKDFGDTVRGHGTHVVGSMVGDALDLNPANEYNGMAPKAKVVFFDIGTPGGDVDPPDDLNAHFFPKPYSLGSRTDSESWGGDATTYDIACREVDQFQYEHKDFMIAIAAGNTGYSGAKTVATPGNAKNGISVGSSQSPLKSFLQRCGMDGNPIHASCDQTSRNLISQKPGMFNEENVACFSSQGPTNNDLRIKPDVMAPGYWVWSASADASANGIDNRCNGVDFVRTDAGTSMSSPVAAGATALIRQYFREGRHPTKVPSELSAFLPSASLVKAVLISGTSSLAGSLVMCDSGHSQPARLQPAPSFIQGWGAVDLNSSLPLFAGDDRTLILSPSDPSIRAREAARKVCFTPVNDSPIRIVLAWTDPPASTAARYALVNDLDLVVTGPNDDEHLGNEGLPNARPGQADTINNVEQVVLSHPVPSATYCAQVSATTVVGGPQDYSLVINGAVRSVSSPGPTIKEVVQNFLAPIPMTAAELASADRSVIIVIVVVLFFAVLPCCLCVICRHKKTPGITLCGRRVCTCWANKCCSNYEWGPTTHCRCFGLRCYRFHRVASFAPLAEISTVSGSEDMPPSPAGRRGAGAAGPRGGAQQHQLLVAADSESSSSPPVVTRASKQKPANPKPSASAATPGTKASAQLHDSMSDMDNPLALPAVGTSAGLEDFPVPPDYQEFDPTVMHGRLSRPGAVVRS